MIARFLRVKVWELDKVADHYQEEAAIILEAQHIAKIKLAEKGESGMAGPGTVVLPEY
jgi:hypothetical protein